MVRSMYKCARVGSLASLVLALSCSAGHALAADPSQDGAQQTGQAGTTASPASATQPIEPAQPKGIPVPDMPVLTTTEVEGVKVEELKIGDGAEIQKGGLVLAHYHGTLVDGGKVFDSSFERGEPAAFPLSGVINGWQVGVPGMKIGGIRRLTIPASLAYGEGGAGNVIPPNADLQFLIQALGTIEVEDVKVGDGEVASNACVAVTAFTMKDDSGKVVDSATAEKPYIWLPGEFQAINGAIEGMKPGGKRTIKIPKELNKPNPMAPSTGRPQDVGLTVDIELLAVRNLK